MDEEIIEETIEQSIESNIAMRIVRASIPTENEIEFLMEQTQKTEEQVRENLSEQIQKRLRQYLEKDIIKEQILKATVNLKPLSLVPPALPKSEFNGLEQLRLILAEQSSSPPFVQPSPGIQSAPSAKRRKYNKETEEKTSGEIRPEDQTPLNVTIPLHEIIQWVQKLNEIILAMGAKLA